MWLRYSPAERTNGCSFTRLTQRTSESSSLFTTNSKVFKASDDGTDTSVAFGLQVRLLVAAQTLLAVVAELVLGGRHCVVIVVSGWIWTGLQAAQATNWGFFDNPPDFYALGQQYPEFKQ
ncbi:uncharacterized protein PITG_21634 [Phytophthora infestans T30-4]|uniref:Uncharacterized protein n=1 Tax=Phytophthora infestans (strain T30-4) TaxID=403677 RepID=D0P4C5_PHYIT|nr:uncharacterized protein PITG_21634 [Phytophthora infestans T30-4]EEY64844.1 hypothetical protein PITG_21634 [Phytophthora infestans T30-4]|eukprot:XP_002894849.1 hypothetical protein PITG_21634 [Phytophthora infestans T30-4]